MSRNKNYYIEAVLRHRYIRSFSVDVLSFSGALSHLSYLVPPSRNFRGNVGGMNTLRIFQIFRNIVLSIYTTIMNALRILHQIYIKNIVLRECTI